uniref:Neuropilin 1b n=1 Tax=Astyanax mexicanus TaxID=7994 RepID=A0A8B9RKQ9_ASTMX
IAASSCGGNITISSAGYVTSPGYPSSYPLSEQCVWLIRAPDPQQKILINFNPHFDLENRECNVNISKFCKKKNIGRIFLKYIRKHENISLECSRNLTAPSGVIRTPGFPDKYPNNLECTIIIFAPKMAEIVLEFESFDIEPDPSAPTGAVCRFDYLEIWDGYPTVGPHIGRYCGQHSPGRVISYTGILSLSIHTDNAISKEGFSANYSIRSSPELPQDQQNECMDPLGMESGEISDEAITASSQYNPSWSPLRSRLNYTKNGWTPSEDSPREWIQVHHNTHTHLFHISLKSITVSHEVFRCLPPTAPVDNSPCSSMLGMVSGHISDAQISVWPEVERGWLPEQARLLTGRSGWVSPISHSATLSPYLELDLGGMRWVTGVVLQGGKHREKSMFVRRFRLSYSTNGSDWSNVLEEYSGKPKLFLGNQNHDTPEVRSFDQLMTRFVRVYPERGGPDGMGLRLELLGCELELTCVFPKSVLVRHHRSPSLPPFTLSVHCEPGNFIYTALSSESLNPETEKDTESTGETKTQREVEEDKGKDVERDGERGWARLVSLPVTAPEEDLCVSFWYQFSGDQAGEEVEEAEEEVLLWMKSRQETGRWREGRVLFPRADSPYQVIIEGVIDGASSGHISVDNVRIVTTVGPEECKVECNDEDEEDTVWRFGRRGGSMLKTLDPILITIIVMSAVGVLLGAVCGVVLYCACSQNPDRNLSALENYNFELVDGIKLKKEKVNAQKSYSEA